MKLGGKRELKTIIPAALDVHNRYLNHHSNSIMQFFMIRYDLNTGKWWKKRKSGGMRFFPAMMLLLGVEDKCIKFMRILSSFATMS